MLLLVTLFGLIGHGKLTEERINEMELSSYIRMSRERESEREREKDNEREIGYRRNMMQGREIHLL